MARLRFMAVALLALAFAGNSTPMGRTQQAASGGSGGTFQTTEPKLATDDPCVIYSLTEMGLDAPLGKWIAETIPEMIEPNSWKKAWGDQIGVVSYYAPKNILIVKQTPAIQKKVDGFLKDLKASMPKASAANSASKMPARTTVVPADYREPNPIPSSYPVAAPVKAPKHLFHFIIRYEGDGIIDDNVVKFMKAQLQGGKPLVSMAPSCLAGAAAGPPAVSEIPLPSTYAAPAAAVPYGGSAPSAAPTLPPAPSVVPAPPSLAPKKKKGKKDEQKKTTVAS